MTQYSPHPSGTLPASASRQPLSLRWPTEHGAWGILFVPFLSAAAVAGGWDLPLKLFFVCLFALFLLRGSLESYRASGAPWTVVFAPVHALLAVVGCAAGLALLWAYERWQLLGVAFAAGLLYLAQRALIAAHSSQHAEKRSLAAELVGVALLTLSAPGTWIAARGTLSRTAVEIWLLCLLFFTGGVLYVKYRVRGVLVHRKFAGVAERLAFAWPVLAYHLLLATFLGTWMTLLLRPAGSGPSTSRVAVLCLAFAPAVLRAMALLLQLGRRFAIPRLGWTEVAHSLLFMALVIFAYRLAS